MEGEKRSWRLSQGPKGIQNKLPQDEALWHAGCFELKAIEILQVQEKLVRLLNHVEKY